MRLTIIIYAMVLAFFDANAQVKEMAQYSMPDTEVRFLHSHTNDVEYKLYISYPISYKDSTNKRYGVLYLLDADYSFAIAKNIVDHLTQRNHLQEIIVIGIAYGGPNQYRINRTRDYTPIHSDEDVPFKEIQSTYSGGGPAFSNFLENELLPYVNTNFRTTDLKAISGHSYGGLFATWLLLTKPTLFNGYIIVSPSLWYAKNFIFGIKEEQAVLTGRNRRAYFSAGNREDPVMPGDLKKFIDRLNNSRIENLTFSYDIGNNETHNSIFPFAISNGIRYVFEGK